MNEYHVNETTQLDDLIRKFIDLADSMLAKGIITEDQHCNLTYNKVRYLKDREVEF